ncbi:MAG: DivIVA domain-containing protein [Clostridia bacterium]|nr:DivIVA domain-containing protein [Clostridia bacterium]
MLTASEIKKIEFSKSINGFKRDEVEVFLDTVESDYLQFERIIKDYSLKIEQLEAQINDFKVSQDSIQNVLLNAQKLADQIINEAKEKSEEIVIKAEQNINVITEQEKELAKAFEIKANERKLALQKELDIMIEKANIKSKSIMDAAMDSVQRQQVLFDKLKLEIASFRSSITAKYKEHLSILQEIPDTVDMDPQKMAEILIAKVDAMPDVDSFLPTPAKPDYVEFLNDLVEEVDEGFTVESVE